MYKLGAKLYGSTDRKELWFNTICHGGDSHKLCYFKNSKSFYCYTNCGYLSIYSLIMSVEKCSFSSSLYFVANELGINSRIGFNQNTRVSNIGKELNDIKQYLDIRKKKSSQPTILPEIQNKKILDYFEDDVFYSGWIREGISIPTMKYFGVKWYELEKHIIIPHFNVNGEVIGIRRRSLQEKDKKNKYMPTIIEGISYAHPLNQNLYGLYEHYEAIKKSKKVIIVESEKSVMLAHEYYGSNAYVVATCGFNISNWHRDVLLGLGVEEVILGFDKDYNILKYTNADVNSAEYKKCLRYIDRVYSLAYKFAPFCRTYVLWDTFDKLEINDSPFDKGVKTLEFLLQNKVEITTNREE